MRHMVLALIIAGGAPLVAFAQSAPTTGPTVRDLWPSDQTGEGRFRIFFSPHARADTFLLDMQTGRVWQLKGLDGEPTAWAPMTRLDNSEDQAAFARAHGVRRATPGPAEQPPPGSPR